MRAVWRLLVWLFAPRRCRRCGGVLVLTRLSICERCIVLGPQVEPMPQSVFDEAEADRLLRQVFGSDDL